MTDILDCPYSQAKLPTTCWRMNVSTFGLQRESLCWWAH